MWSGAAQAITTATCWFHTHCSYFPPVLICTASCAPRRSLPCRLAGTFPVSQPPEVTIRAVANASLTPARNPQHVFGPTLPSAHTHTHTHKHSASSPPPPTLLASPSLSSQLYRKALWPMPCRSAQSCPHPRFPIRPAACRKEKILCSFPPSRVLVLFLFQQQQTCTCPVFFTSVSMYIAVGREGPVERVCRVCILSIFLLLLRSADPRN